MLGDVHRLKRPTSTGVLFVVEFQDDLHDALPTRLVAPMVEPERIVKPLRGVHPTVLFGGKTWIVVTSELTPVPTSDLDLPSANLASARGDLLAALDLLVTGI